MKNFLKGFGLTFVALAIGLTYCGRKPPTAQIGIITDTNSPEFRAAIERDKAEVRKNMRYP